ncbi:MAG: M20/M25/M40 family metallo-hydrolase [Chlorobi bacterium]|nr:M20/M25/M40 family metallo-hydrolase [Chlorobiota bacterium]
MYLFSISFTGFFVTWLLLFLAPVDRGSAPEGADRVITAGNLQAHVTYLASDELGGRGTGTEGFRKAGDYIIQYFKSIGIQPVNGSYEHHFNRYRLSLADVESQHLEYVAPAGMRTTFNIKQHFLPFLASGNGDVTANAVFAGYGLVLPKQDWNDYAGKTVQGKIVVISAGRPGFLAHKNRSLLEQLGTSSRIREAVERGAAAVVIIPDLVKQSGMTPQGYLWSSLMHTRRSRITPTISARKGLNVVGVNRVVVNALFGSLDTVRSMFRVADSLRTPPVFDLRGKLRVATALKFDTLTNRNIIGLWPGGDENLKHELVVVGAHYDHLGISRTAVKGDSILNGADDNASGTAAVMEIARAYTRCDIRPRRSILFILFAAEELGLVGSRAYTANPSLPIEDHVAMLNLDMIGRNNPDSLSIGGVDRCPELKQINEEENAGIGFTLAYNVESFFYRSDQASFALKKIPVIFYFTGEHKDYHRVTDEADLLNYDKLARVARLAFRTSWRVADLDHKLQYTEPGYGSVR